MGREWCLPQSTSLYFVSPWRRPWRPKLWVWSFYQMGCSCISYIEGQIHLILVTASHADRLLFHAICNQTWFLCNPAIYVVFIRGCIHWCHVRSSTGQFYVQQCNLLPCASHEMPMMGPCDRHKTCMTYPYIINNVAPAEILLPKVIHPKNWSELAQSSFHFFPFFLCMFEKTWNMKLY